MNQLILKRNAEKKKKKNKNENILCAIIALMKELDKSGLEFVKLDAMKRISKLDQRAALKKNARGGPGPSSKGAGPPSGGHRL